MTIDADGDTRVAGLLEAPAMLRGQVFAQLVDPGVRVVLITAFIDPLHGGELLEKSR